MKKVFSTLLVMAIILCFSLGALAAPLTPSDNTDPNQYVITEALQQFNGTDELWIGTLEKWQETREVGDTGTVFVNGEAINPHDIIITNGKVGVTLAVGTRNPWGYPAGSILDAGIMTGTDDNMVGGRDTVWSIEILVNGWDSWAPDNCGKVTFDLVNYDFNAKQEVNQGGLSAVKVSRIYDIDDVKFDVVTYYGIAPDANYVMMFDQLTNKSGQAIESLSNRLSLTNKGDDGGAMYNINESHQAGCYGNTDKNQYNTSIIMPGKNISSTGDSHAWNKTGGSVGYKELRSNYGYKNGESVVLEDYIVISNEPTTKDVNSFIMDYNDVKTRTTVSGTVKDSSNSPISEPVIVVEKDGATYGWYMGNEDGEFSFTLPQDGAKYTAYVERNGFAPGAIKDIDTTKDSATLDLTSGAEKVNITFTIKDSDDNPLYGKVELFDAKGNSAYPTVRFCGNSIYQTMKKGIINAEIAPGDYIAVIYGEGFWFYSNPVEVKANTSDGNKEVVVDKIYSAPQGWLSGDLHHHANKNDAFADPQDAIPSMLAAGLDVAFITDHDFTVNNKKAYDLAIQYGMAGFVPSEEVSCSWAHFNVIPQNEQSYELFRDDDSDNDPIINQFGKLPVFINEAHSKGATITANHPWYTYGLFSANDAGAIPGGYTDEYDTIELNATCADNENVEVLISATQLWTSFTNGTAAKDESGKVIYKDAEGKDVITEKPHYLVGGSDTHDVLYPGFSGDNYENVRANASESPYAQNLGYSTYTSGKIRTYAYVDEIAKTDVIDNGLAFAKAVAAGNSYTTYGPLLDMDKIPGELYGANDYFYLNMEIKSLANIKDILVLTKDADTDYEGAGLPASMYTEQYVKYDKEASRLNVNAKEIDFNAKVALPKGESTWVAFMVIDENGNYAITNPYWVQNEARVSSFSDVNPDAWFAPYVNALTAEKIIKGYGDNTFRPQNNITRAEFATLMAAIAPEAKDKKEVSFSDVAKGSWYYDSVVYMAENGYIQGYGNNSFKPQKNITRAEISTILTNVYGNLGGSGKTTFTDVKAESWYYEAVMNLAKAGYINGFEDGSFRPDENATRAQAAKMVYVAKYGGKVLLNDAEL